MVMVDTMMELPLKRRRVRNCDLYVTDVTTFDKHRCTNICWLADRLYYTRVTREFILSRLVLETSLDCIYAMYRVVFADLYKTKKQ